MLIGRERELRPVAALLEEARRGRSSTLTVVGDPGVGKTALLGEARRLATGMRVVACTGVESESELAYASLHELLGPLLELRTRIPDSQANAVAAALALAAGEADPLAVGAGTLSLFAEAADSVPLFVVLDDVQWMDSASVEAIAFAARRLRNEPIAVLAALRPSSAPAFEPFARLDLGPLDPGDARRLLADRAHPVLPADVSRLLAVAAGNPLALLELPVELTRELPTSTEPHEGLKKTFARRVGALPRSAQLGLLLAAAEPEVRSVRLASAALGIEDALDVAERAGLVRLDGTTVVFRHPVVRSLIYADAPFAERIAVHRALADVLSAEEDRDRCAWHLGASVDGVDEGIAALLEATAEGAIARGGLIAAARALERAARLSPSRSDRARRLVAAIDSQRVSGDQAKTRALAEEALLLVDDPLVRFDLLFHLRVCDEWEGKRVREEVLLEELEQSAALDDERRVKLIYELVTLRLDSFDAAGAAALAPMARRYARGAGAAWGPRAVGLAASAYLFAGQRARAAGLLRALDDQNVAAVFAFDYMSLEWYDALRAAHHALLRDARRDGNLYRIGWIQCCAAHVELRHGRLAGAEAAAAEAIRIGEMLDDKRVWGIAAAAFASVHAWRGAVEVCAANARDAAAFAREARDSFAEGVAQAALGLLALGTGRPVDGVSALEPLAQRWATSTVADPAAVPFVPDLVEAYALTGAAPEARALLDRFSRHANAAKTTWSLAVSLRCEALLAAGDEFEPHLVAAVELLDGSPYTLDLARTRLALGERLRRAGRRRDARVQLHAAYDAFSTAGAAPWEERAAAELRATGVSVATAAPRRPDLTPQELHIATLVTEGKSNKEIAAAIYLSPKTVEYHLANTFRKLDIHSRAELARLMAESVSAENSPGHDEPAIARMSD